MYEVIHYFTDLQDNKYPYNVGDIFPRDGLVISEKRLKELSSSNNRQHKPLIKKMSYLKNEEELLPFEPRKYTKSEISRMNIAELQNLAAEEGIENISEKSGGELKKILIEYFEL